MHMSLIFFLVYAIIVVCPACLWEFPMRAERAAVLSTVLGAFVALAATFVYTNLLAYSRGVVICVVSCLFLQFLLVEPGLHTK